VLGLGVGSSINGVGAGVTVGLGVINGAGVKSGAGVTSGVGVGSIGSTGFFYLAL